MIKSLYFWKRAPITRPNNCFNEIAGVNVHFDRLPPPYNYGSRGKPTKFYATKEFQEKLDRCFAELWKVCPLGRAEVITSAGAYTDKPGWHGKGRAFDLDGIFWMDKDFVADRYLDDTSFYLGVNAILLKHFGTVLNYHYDNAHRDHFHIQDDGRKGGFEKKPSTLLFLKSVLKHLFREDVCIDAESNKDTKVAIMRVLENLHMRKKFNDGKTWEIFMTQIAKKAFENT